MVGSLQPLDQNFPVVDPLTGKPTLYFTKWAQQRQIDITDGISGAEAQALIDAWAAGRSIIAGAGLTGGGTLDADRTLSADTQAILNGISSTQGTILYRGAASWSALAPGTSGQFLKTNGAGANPSWATVSGGGGGGMFGPDIMNTIGGNLTSAFSGGGQVFTPYINLNVTGGIVVVDSDGTRQYKLFVATVTAKTLDSTGNSLSGANPVTLGTVLGEQAFTTPSTNNQYTAVQFSSPIALTANQDYFFGIQRTDATATSTSQIAWSTQEIKGYGFPGFVYSRIANINTFTLAGSTCPSFDAGSAFSMVAMPFGTG